MVARFNVAANVPERFQMRLKWHRSVNERNILFVEAIGEHIDQNTIWNAPEDIIGVSNTAVLNFVCLTFLHWSNYHFRSSYDPLWTV